MIVISGALVLVALVLLVLGITMTELDFVYASIVVSLVSFVFLLIGILQRRGDKSGAETPAEARSDSGETAAALEKEPVAAAAAAPTAAAAPARVRQRSAGSRRVTADADAPAADSSTEELPVAEEPGALVADGALPDGQVLVVPGRPRYHVAGCRYLTGKTPTEVGASDARDEGFTPCGVCRPDEALSAGTSAEPALAAEPVMDPEPVVPVAEPAAEPVAAVAPTRRTRSTSTAAASTAASAPRKAPTRRSPRPTASAAAAVAAAAPAQDPVLETVAAEAPASQTAAAAPARRRQTTVVVIPDRGKYHRAECRYVRNADGATILTKSAATRQGYDACGVCKP